MIINEGRRGEGGKAFKTDFMSTPRRTIYMKRIMIIGPKPQIGPLYFQKISFSSLSTATCPKLPLYLAKWPFNDDISIYIYELYIDILLKTQNFVCTQVHTHTHAFRHTRIQMDTVAVFAVTLALFVHVVAVPVADDDDDDNNNGSFRFYWTHEHVYMWLNSQGWPIATHERFWDVYFWTFTYILALDGTECQPQNGENRS